MRFSHQTHSYAPRFGVAAFLQFGRGSNSEVCPSGKCIGMATPFFVSLCLLCSFLIIHNKALAIMTKTIILLTTALLTAVVSSCDSIIQGVVKGISDMELVYNCLGTRKCQICNGLVGCTVQAQDTIVIVLHVQITMVDVFLVTELEKCK